MLQNQTYDYEGGVTVLGGTVLVCVNRTYQPICDVGWDDIDAQVVCNILYGFNYYGMQKSFIFRSFTVLISHCTVGEAVSGQIIYQNQSYIAQDIVCNGTEYSFSSCRNNTVISTECSSRNSAAGVVCREGECHFIAYECLRTHEK